MNKFVLASLFVVAAAAMQPALAAKAAEPKLCGKGTKICACGKLPAAIKVRLLGRPAQLQALTEGPSQAAANSRVVE